MLAGCTFNAMLTKNRLHIRLHIVPFLIPAALSGYYEVILQAKSHIILLAHEFH